MWQKINITTDEGIIKEAIAPIIISASRSTDIPAFYSQWFIQRWNKGHSTWINRSFKPTKICVIVFHRLSYMFIGL